MIYNSWNSAQPNISFTDLVDAWSGLGDMSLILDVLQNHYSNDAHLRILLKEVRTLQQLYQLASSSNYSNFVSNSINATSYQDLSFVMYQSSALTFSSYLKLVRTHFGTTNYSSMMSDIGEWLKFGKDILLQEQHIYGSSRLGMYQSNQLLVKYKYKYSDTLQIYLDSVKFDRDTNRAMRKLSHKQYELTNHLGNVLSTVLDRKTPVTSSGGSGGSTTITHYEGDVLFASDYYPFGSPMSWTTSDSSGGRLYSGGGYRFGFNGKENDRETQTQYFDFRTYFQKLGRFSSVDPLVMLAPDKTPYHFVSNNPINRIDPLGLTDYYVNGEIRKIDDGHKGVSIKVSEEQFNELQRKFERGSSGYEKMMNRMSVQNGFQTYSDFGEEYTDADGIYHHIGVSITVHKAGGDSYSDWSKNKSLDNIGQVNDVVDNIGGSLGANAGLTRLGTNGKLYFETPNGGVFRGNQYVSTTSIAKYGSKIGRVTGPVGYAISAGQIGYGVYRDGGQFGYNAQVATGGAVGGTLGGMAGAWAGAKTFGAAGLLIGGPVGGAIGGVIGGIVGGVAGGYYGGEFGEQVVK